MDRLPPGPVGLLRENKKLGDLYAGLGRGDEALGLHQQSLEVRRQLVEAEPGRADYCRDPSVSYNKLGDLYDELLGAVESRG